MVGVVRHIGWYGCVLFGFCDLVQSWCDDRIGCHTWCGCLVGSSGPGCMPVLQVVGMVVGPSGRGAVEVPDDIALVLAGASLVTAGLVRPTRPFAVRAVRAVQIVVGCLR